MAYTPELSQPYSATLRRLAWALELPMTETIEKVFDYVVGAVEKKRVCTKCRDKTKCAECAFSQRSQEHEQGK